MKRAGRRFASTHALREIDLSVIEGDSILVLGPNGSGKSTLLRLACGLLRPTSGVVTLWGQDPMKSRARIGYIGHEPRLYPFLSLKENLSFFASLYGVAESRVDELLDSVGLAEKSDKHANTASRGELQRTAIARGLINNPDLLLADEPFTALDDEAAELLPGLLLEPGRALMVASHDVARAKALTEKTIRLEAGRVLRAA